MGARRAHSVHQEPFAGLGVLLRFPDWPATRMVVWTGDDVEGSARHHIARMTGRPEADIDLCLLDARSPAAP